MPLPILPSHRSVSTQDLVRLYHHTELQWVRQTSEEATLDCGSAFTNPALGNVYDANLMIEASLADGASAADAVAEADTHFRSRGVRCAKWILNPAVAIDRTEPLAAHLLCLGFIRQTYDLMYLAGQPASPIQEARGLQIIPGRASFHHARALLEESAAAFNQPQVVEAGMLHLEDPQTDSRIALKDGAAAGLVTVLAVGELGCIEDIFVSEPFRGQGIARTLMSRALEICARSLFKHVFLCVDGCNAPALGLYRKMGFDRLAPYVLYRAPHALP